MLEPFDVKDIFTVAARLKRMHDAKAFMSTTSFKIDFETLIELIEKWKKQNEK